MDDFDEESEFDENDDVIGYCQLCGNKITFENSTSYSNICLDCGGNGADILINLFG